MFKKSKKFVSLLIALVLCMSVCIQPLCVSAAAAVPPDVELQWQHAYDIKLTLSTYNNKSTFAVRVRVLGHSGTTYSGGIVSLTKLDGDDAGLVKMWNKLSSDTSLFELYDVSVPYVSGTYRITLSITTKNNGASEMVRVYEDFTV